MNNTSEFRSKKKEITPFNARFETKQSLKIKFYSRQTAKKLKLKNLMIGNM